MSMERPPLLRPVLEGDAKQQLERVLRDVAACAEDPAVIADCSVVALRDGDAWIPHFVRIDICRPLPKLGKGHWIYPEVLYAREQLPVLDVVERLGGFLRGDAGLQTRGHLIAPRDPRHSPAWDAELHGSFNDYTRWPCVHYSTQLDERARNLVRRVYGPLVSADPYPYFDNLSALLERVVRFRPFHGGQDGRIGHLHIVMWRYVAHFTNARPDDDGALTVSIGGDSLAGVKLVGQFVGPEGETQFREPAAPEVRVSPKSPPDRATIVLVGPDHALLDMHRIDLTGFVARSADAEALLKAQLAGGESATTEFKPYVSLTETSKWEEVLRTCIGFANAEGGSVVVGVDDHGSPRFNKDDRKAMGADGELRGDVDAADRRAVLERAVTAYADKLRDRVQVHANRSLDISYWIVWIDAVPVLVMYVAKGESPPYMDTRDNSVWFRANATTRQANEAELRSVINTNAAQRWDE